MRTGLTISSGVHAAMLAFALWTFHSSPFESGAPESMPVDVISAKDFSKLTEGVQTAQKQEQPKPLVDKAGEKKPATDASQKLTEKQDIAPAKTEKTLPAPPQEEPKKIPPKPPEKTEAKPEKKPETKTDPIAEALKKEEAKKVEEKKAETGKPKIPQKPVKPQPTFDPSKVAALLDKRDPQRQAVTGEAINRTASIGAAGASAPELSQSELDALRARLQMNWSPPAGAEKVSISIYVSLSKDGRLAGPPRIVTSGRGKTFDAAREAALRAVLLSMPFSMLRPETYESWKETELVFDETLVRR
jgi:colicin import membrane protein